MAAPAPARRRAAPSAPRPAATRSPGAAVAPAAPPRAAGVDVRPVRPGGERAPLRVVAPRPRHRRRAGRRTALAALAIAVAAPLSVVGLYADMTAGQVRLARLQQQLTAEQQRQNTLELRVARLENPSTIVAEARVQGMVPASKVTQIPEVPVGVEAAAPSTAASSQPRASVSASGSRSSSTRSSTRS